LPSALRRCPDKINQPLVPQFPMSGAGPGKQWRPDPNRDAELDVRPHDAHALEKLKQEAPKPASRGNGAKPSRAGYRPCDGCLARVRGYAQRLLRHRAMMRAFHMKKSKGPGLAPRTVHP
jgi:hypothetical protein